MNVNSINASPISARPSSTSPDSSGGGKDAQIKNLEQKLIQLNREKDRAKEAGNPDKVRELTLKIRKLEQQLEKLRAEEARKKQKPARDSASSPDSRLPGSDTGNYVDEII